MCLLFSSQWYFNQSNPAHFYWLVSLMYDKPVLIYLIHTLTHTLKPRLAKTPNPPASASNTIELVLGVCCYTKPVLTLSPLQHWKDCLSPYPSSLKKHVFEVLFFLPRTVTSCVQKRWEVLMRRKQEQLTLRSSWPGREERLSILLPALSALPALSFLYHSPLSSFLSQACGQPAVPLIPWITTLHVCLTWSG